jgi:hypothetical protein
MLKGALRQPHDTRRVVSTSLNVQISNLARYARKTVATKVRCIRICLFNFKVR